MLTFIIPFLVGTIVGFLIRGKPSDTFAITTGKRAAWAIGFGFGGLLIGMPIGLAISSTTGPQIAGLVGTGLGLGVLNILSIENLTYKKWSDKNAFLWLIGGVVVLVFTLLFIDKQIPKFTQSADKEDQQLSADATDPQSLRELLSAAEGGDLSAQLRLGALYRVGDPPVDRNIVESMKWYRRAAEQGVAAAQHNLGELYAIGENNDKNDAEAVKWFRLAANQGYAIAQFDLGYMYSIGDMVSKDSAEATRWYRLAADQGNTNAQYNLGVMYANGAGVPKNDAEAVKWFRLAANQGDASAQLNVGLMYANGDGVPKNAAEAYFWLNLAAAQGNADAKTNRDIIEKEMTREQIVEAQWRAVAWKPKTE